MEKKKMKQFLGIMLSLVMVVGLIAQMNLTVFADEVTPTTYVITSENFDQYFSGGYLVDTVEEGSILDFQGTFSKNDLVDYTANGQIFINKKVDVTSSTEDAVFISEDTTNYWRFRVSSGADNITVSNLEFTDGAFYIQGASGVTVDSIKIVANKRGIGGGTGFLSIHTDAENTVVKNSYFENGGTGSSCVVTGKGGKGAVFEDNTFVISGSAGNVLSMNQFLGNGDSPTNITIRNNTFNVSVPGSAFMYIICVMGEGNVVEGNTVDSYAGSILVNSYGGPNTYRNNKILGGGGMSFSKGSIVEGNILEGQVVVSQGVTFTNNTVTTGTKVVNISGKDAVLTNNDITGIVNISSSASNTHFTDNDVTGTVTVKSKENKITGNVIISSKEYAVELNSSADDQNTEVTDNILIAAEKVGDDAVNPGNGGGNTIRNNGSVLYPLWVGGVHVNDLNAIDTTGERGWSYDAESKTLTLDNYDNENAIHAFEQNEFPNTAAIYAQEELTIVLSGENYITNVKDKPVDEVDNDEEVKVAASGIFANDNLTITGDGSVSIEVSGNQPTGIYIDDDANIKDCDIDVTCTGAKSTGIAVLDGLHIIDSEVTAVANGPIGDVDNESSMGIRFHDGLVIEGSSVIATGGLYGINGNDGDDLVTISDDITVVKAIGKDATKGKGIFSKVENAIEGTGWKDAEDDSTAELIAVGTHEAAELADYKAVQFLAVKSATVTKAPTPKVLPYTGQAQALVTAGVAEGGTMQYALGKDATTAPTDGWSESIPSKTDAGTYYVWYKAVGDKHHADSEAKCVTVKILAQISAKITFTVVNGSWDDGTTADKTVTLTGFEGDTLKLAANQIPTVGNKPNDNFKAGSWDVTPAADKAITKDTKFTYTYAAKEADLTPEEQAKKNEIAINAGFKVTQKGSKIKVEWGKVEDADSYEVYVSYCGKKFTKKATKTTTKESVSEVNKLKGKKLNLKKNFKVKVVAMKDGKQIGKDNHRTCGRKKRKCEILKR